MASANREQGGATELPELDHPNQENMLPGLRQTKNTLENQENMNPKQSIRTALGVLQNNQRSRSHSQRGTKQGASSQVLSCKNEDSGKGLAERAGNKQPAFQIHVDEPDGACSKNQVLKTKSLVENTLTLNPSVVRLRQPLATIDISMDVGFDSPMDMSVVEAEEKPANTNEVLDYAAEIHKHLREMELKCRPKAGYMKKQPDITNSMRAILVDWLVEVGEEYKLQNETLYLAVNYIDRFLSSMSVLRGKLQLVGTAAMLLASKFEEIYAPEVAEFVYITDDTYTKKQVLRMEHLVLEVLSFDLAAPTINQFLTQYFLHQPVDSKVESLSMGASSQVLSCKNEDSGKGLAERAGNKQPAFQIHVDEPDGACSKNQVLKTKSLVENTLTLNPSVVRLRQPLATIDISMDVGFDSPMDMSVVEAEEKPANTNEVLDYAAEIHKHLREMELKCRPKAGYMKKQPDITNSMRAILVDWLVEVGEEYKLQNETLYLAVNYIDRFLSSMSVLTGKLQLVGTVAMLLASKFEEIYAPEVAEFVYITDDTYTKKQVLRMEHLVLEVLSFDLAAPTINQFLTHYFLHQPVDSKVESLSMFLGELSLIDSDPFLKYLPSQTAAAAFVVANYTIARGSWSPSLEEVTGYSLEDLMPCVNDLHETYLNAARHAQQSVREKYKGSKYHEVSLIDPPVKLFLN